jgi:hypothetical protein
MTVDLTGVTVTLCAVVQGWGGQYLFNIENSKELIHETIVREEAIMNRSNI